MAEITGVAAPRSVPTRDQGVRVYELAGIRFPEGDVDPRQVVLSYDRPSDTVLIFLFGRERRSVVVGHTDYTFLLVDPGTNEFVGLQIEDFLACAVKDDPRLARLLEYAELRGTTRAEVRQECRIALDDGHGPYQQRNRSIGRSRQPGAMSRKDEIVQDVLNDPRLGLPMHVSLGQSQS